MLLKIYTALPCCRARNDKQRDSRSWPCPVKPSRASFLLFFFCTLSLRGLGARMTYTQYIRNELVTKRRRRFRDPIVNVVLSRYIYPEAAGNNEKKKTGLDESIFATRNSVISTTSGGGEKKLPNVINIITTGSATLKTRPFAAALYKTSRGGCLAKTKIRRGINA